MSETLSLFETYLHLKDGPDVGLIEVGPDFWAKIQTRTDLEQGRMVMAFSFDADWATWEMHPEGDEIVVLLSGAIELVPEEPTGERTLELRDSGACVVPRGVWHTARVSEPCQTLHITQGAGTQHRPVA